MVTRIVSIGTKVKQVAGLLGTKDLSAWEQGFVADIDARTINGEQTQRLTERQVEIIEKIYSRHFS